MPVDSMLLSIAICSVFLIFAAALAWADYSTGSERSAKPEADPADPLRKHAA